MPSARRAARSGVALLLWLAALLAHAVPTAPAGPLHIVEAQRAVVTGADWDAPATPDTALQAAQRAGWATVALPYAQPRQPPTRAASSASAPQVAWFRITLPPGAVGAGAFLYLPRWQARGNLAIYAGHRLVFRSYGERIWAGFNRPLWIPITATAHGPPPATLMLRIASAVGAGTALSPIWVGSEPALRWRYWVRTALQLGLVAFTSAGVLTAGAFAFAVWLQRRRDTVYALFAANALMYVLYSLRFLFGSAPLLPGPVFLWLTETAAAWWIAFTYVLTLRLLRRPQPRRERAALALAALLSLLTWPGLLPAAALGPLESVQGALMGLAALMILVPSITVWRHDHSRAGLVLSLWFLLSIWAGLNDYLLAHYLAPTSSLYLSPYIAIGLFAIFLALLYGRYTGALRTLESAHEQLAARLIARERALHASYVRLQALERQRTLDTERERMTREMHDGVGSSLISALRMAEGGALRPDDMARVLRECIDDLKLAMDTLEYHGSNLLDLLATLRFRLGPRLQAAGLTLHWRVCEVPPLPWLDAQSALHILRILQEVLANILKHSGARSISVATASSDASVLIDIDDDGAPHHVPAPPGPERAGEPSPHGRGLRDIRTRAAALGATCTWTTRPGGNRFELRLPRNGPHAASQPAAALAPVPDAAPPERR